MPTKSYLHVHHASSSHTQQVQQRSLIQLHCPAVQTSNLVGDGPAMFWDLILHSFHQELISREAGIVAQLPSSKLRPAVVASSKEEKTHIQQLKRVKLRAGMVRQQVVKRTRLVWQLEGPSPPFKNSEFVEESLLRETKPNAKPGWNTD
ncbi:hypothetical protein LR48_Vigan09g049200 [Vigna angularis]|nr:hypothetical protein LR48_Vigan09g049200 [Vigna angularis]